jgi:hypothetical protein
VVDYLSLADQLKKVLVTFPEKRRGSGIQMRRPASPKSTSPAPTSAQNPKKSS